MNTLINTGCTRQLRDLWLLSSVWVHLFKEKDLQIWNYNVNQFSFAFVEPWLPSSELGHNLSIWGCSQRQNYALFLLRNNKACPGRQASHFQAYCIVETSLAFYSYPQKWVVTENPLMCFAQILAVHFLLSFPCCLPGHQAKCANNRCSPTPEIHGCIK